MIDNVRDAITYLLPGFVAYLLYRRAVPLREESDLTLAAKSMIWSLLINASITASTLIARGYHAIDWSSPVAILWQLLLAVLSGLGLGLLERKRHVLNACWRVFDVRMSKREDPWSEVLDLDSVGGGCAYVRTTDGFTCYGWVSQYTDLPHAEPKELVLDKAWRFSPGSSEPDELGRAVLLRSDAIVAIEMAETGRELGGQTGNA